MATEQEIFDKYKARICADYHNLHITPFKEAIHEAFEAGAGTLSEWKNASAEVLKSLVGDGQSKDDGEIFKEVFTETLKELKENSREKGIHVMTQSELIDVITKTTFRGIREGRNAGEAQIAKAIFKDINKGFGQDGSLEWHGDNGEIHPFLAELEAKYTKAKV